MRPYALLAVLMVFSGCAGANQIFGSEKLNVPPEFNQKIILEVSDKYELYQAPRSGYDVGDFQAFHTQQTFPVVVEDAFKQIFGEVVVPEKGKKIEMGPPEVPAIFEVRILDLANDIYNGADNYRAQVTVAVVMKSPRDQTFWEKTFRGEGYVRVDPQFSTGLGPQDAVLSAVQDVLEQMKKAIVASPEVRNQLRYYQKIQTARAATEKKV